MNAAKINIVDRINTKDLRKPNGVVNLGTVSVFYKYKRRINDSLQPVITFPKVVDQSVLSENEILVFYEDCSDEKTMLSEASELSLEELKNKAHVFWSGYYRRTSQTFSTARLNDYPSKVFFEERFLSRSVWYGDDFSQLITDIQEHMATVATDIVFMIRELFYGLDNEEKVLCSECHGDLHHLNMCFSGVFFDDETYGTNPVMGDIACYEWFIEAQTNWLLPKYKPFFLNGAPDLNEEKIRILKEAFYDEYAKKSVQEANKNNLKWKKDYAFRLLCRIIFIQNTLEFEVKDRLRIYQYLNTLNKWLLDDTQNNNLPFC